MKETEDLIWWNRYGFLRWRNSTINKVLLHGQINDSMEVYAVKNIAKDGERNMEKNWNNEWQLEKISQLETTPNICRQTL